MVNAADCHGQSDSEILQRAVDGRGKDGIVIVPPHPEREFWLLDRAVLLPENTTVVLRGCKIKLSDKCRDNFFRSANCGTGIECPERIHNIHIRGEGGALLEGADRPRSTGDSGKTLRAPLTGFSKEKTSFGADCGKENESQTGDWRNIGVLFANVEDFSVSDITVKDSHCWALSFEQCANGRIERIRFDSRAAINGMCAKNQDGIDLRCGCHDMIISDITGRTGDDVIALTAIAGEGYAPGGAPGSCRVMPRDRERFETDIHDVIIKNVLARSVMYQKIRLLPCEARIYNVVIDGVTDTAKDPETARCAVILGERDGAYGRNLPDSMRNIIINNVICSSREAVWVKGYLTDSVISNVINRNPACPALRVERENGLKNVKTYNVVTAGE